MDVAYTKSSKQRTGSHHQGSTLPVGRTSKINGHREHSGGGRPQTTDGVRQTGPGSPTVTTKKQQRTRHSHEGQKGNGSGGLHLQQRGLKGTTSSRSLSDPDVLGGSQLGHLMGSLDGSQHSLEKLNSIMRDGDRILYANTTVNYSGGPAGNSGISSQHGSATQGMTDRSINSNNWRLHDGSWHEEDAYEDDMIYEN